MLTVFAWLPLITGIMNMKALKGIKDQITLTIDVEMMGDYGKIEKLPLELTFKKINDIDEAKEMFSQFESGDRDELKAMSEHLVSWDLAYDDDTPVVLSDETLAEVWQVAPYRNALVKSFIQVQLGYQALQSKN